MLQPGFSMVDAPNVIIRETASQKKAKYINIETTDNSSEVAERTKDGKDMIQQAGDNDMENKDNVDDLFEEEQEKVRSAVIMTT